MNGISYVVNSLPFGWAHSPVITIENVARFLILAHPSQVILIQYLDDVVLVSTDSNVLRWDTRQLVEDLVEEGWVVSPKSVVEPSTSITWMGKTIKGESYEIQQSSVYIAQMVTMWLRLSCQGYSEKRCRRLVGKFLWAAAPGRLTLPFLQGPIAWSVWGPPCAPYTPQNVLRLLCEVLA